MAEGNEEALLGSGEVDREQGCNWGASGECDRGREDEGIKADGGRVGQEVRGIEALAPTSWSSHWAREGAEEVLAGLSVCGRDEDDLVLLDELKEEVERAGSS